MGKIVLVLAALAALLLANTINAFTKDQFSDYFLWSNAVGDDVIILKDGTIATFAVQWVGLSGWDDLNGIQNWYNGVPSNQIAYLHDYSLGTLIYGTRNVTYDRANAFSTSLAKMIGNRFAFIVLDTEWDADGMSAFATSSAGIQSFLARVNAYRTYAPNAILASSPGLWTVPYGTTINYAAFKPVDAKLDLRAVLYSAVSTDSSCTWRQLAGSGGATTVFTDGKALSTAVTIASACQRMTGYETNFWGATSKKWIMADIAITDCGWGVTGQAAVVQAIVNSMSTLFASGYRGMSMRNYSPPNQYRFMGINNEAGFTWYPPSSGKNNTSVAVQNGLNLAIKLMKSLTSSSGTGTTTTTKAGTVTTTTKAPTTTTKAPTTTTKAPTTASPTSAFTVSRVTSLWTSTRIVVSATPTSKISKITASYTDVSNIARTVTLSLTSGTTQYRATLSNTMKTGTAVTIKITSTTGTTNSYTVYNGAALTVKMVQGSWNRYWIQVSVSPNTRVKSVSAKFTTSTGVAKTIALQSIANTNQYMGNPTTNMPSGCKVTIVVTLTDGGVQTYTITNIIYSSRSEEEETQPQQEGEKRSSTLYYVFAGILTCLVVQAVVAVVIVGIVKLRERVRGDKYKRPNTLLSPTGEYPTSPVDGVHGEEMVEINDQ